MASILIDILRSAHLLFFAAGMGTSLYYDFRTFQSIHDPIDETEIQGLMRIHTWVSLAFGCLWVSGIALIYIRTAFDLAAFSPKLWLKVGIMTLMVWNAQKIGRQIIPLLKDNVGTPMIRLPTPQLLGATQLAVNSMFCWTAGLILGSSVAVKTAPWETLIIASISWFALLTIATQTTVFLMNMKNQRALNAENISTTAISR